ncbi:radical SAM protein, partial [Candidatus Omnitrophota bacterium]
EYESGILERIDAGKPGEMTTLIYWLLSSPERKLYVTYRLLQEYYKAGILAGDDPCVGMSQDEIKKYVKAQVSVFKTMYTHGGSDSQNTGENDSKDTALKENRRRRSPSGVTKKSIQSALISDRHMTVSGAIFELQRLDRIFTAYHEILTSYGQDARENERRILHQLQNLTADDSLLARLQRHQAMRKAGNIISHMPDLQHIDVTRSGKRNFINWFIEPSASTGQNHIIGDGCTHPCHHCFYDSPIDRVSFDPLPVVIRKILNGKLLSGSRFAPFFRNDVFDWHDPFFGAYIDSVIELLIRLVPDVLVDICTRGWDPDNKNVQRAVERVVSLCASVDHKFTLSFHMLLMDLDIIEAIKETGGTGVPDRLIDDYVKWYGNALRTLMPVLDEISLYLVPEHAKGASIVNEATLKALRRSLIESGSDESDVRLLLDRLKGYRGVDKPVYYIDGIQVDCRGIGPNGRGDSFIVKLEEAVGGAARKLRVIPEEDCANAAKNLGSQINRNYPRVEKYRDGRIIVPSMKTGEPLIEIYSEEDSPRPIRVSTSDLSLADTPAKSPDVQKGTRRRSSLGAEPEIQASSHVAAPDSEAPRDDSPEVDDRAPRDERRNRSRRRSPSGDDIKEAYREEIECSQKKADGTYKFKLTLHKSEEEVGFIDIVIEDRGLIAYSCTGIKIHDPKREGDGTELVFRGFNRALEKAHELGLNPEWALVYYTLNPGDDPKVIDSISSLLRKKLGFKMGEVIDYSLGQLMADYPDPRPLGGIGYWHLKLTDLAMPQEAEAEPKTRRKSPSGKKAASDHQPEMYQEADWFVPQEIAENAVHFTRYMHDQNYDSVIMSGGSACVIRRMFEAAWKNLYDEPLPRIIELSQEQNFALYKGRYLIEEAIARQRRSSIRDYFDPDVTEKILLNVVSQEDLETLRQERVAIIDEISRNGGKCNRIKGVLYKTGFNSLDFLSFTGLRTQDRLREHEYHIDHTHTFDRNVYKAIHYISMLYSDRAQVDESYEWRHLVEQVKMLDRSWNPELQDNEFCIAAAGLFEQTIEAIPQHAAELRLSIAEEKKQRRRSPSGIAEAVDVESEPEEMTASPEDAIEAIQNAHSIGYDILREVTKLNHDISQFVIPINCDYLPDASSENEDVVKDILRIIALKQLYLNKRYGPNRIRFEFVTVNEQGVIEPVSDPKKHRTLELYNEVAGNIVNGSCKLSTTSDTSLYQRSFVITGEDRIPNDHNVLLLQGEIDIPVSKHDEEKYFYLWNTVLDIAITQTVLLGQETSVRERFYSKLRTLYRLIGVDEKVLTNDNIAKLFTEDAKKQQKTALEFIIPHAVRLNLMQLRMLYDMMEELLIMV